MEAPKELAAHQGVYKANAWEAYTFMELGNFVHLLAKRSEHRSDADKKAKDLYDAQNYLSMMQSKLDELKPKRFSTGE
jgi:hypothetical protein